MCYMQYTIIQYNTIQYNTIQYKICKAPCCRGFRGRFRITTPVHLTDRFRNSAPKFRGDRSNRCRASGFIRDCFSARRYAIARYLLHVVVSVRHKPADESSCSYLSCTVTRDLDTFATASRSRCQQSSSTVER